MSPRTPVAVVGSGNIGTDLVEKLQRSPSLDCRWVVGIDPDSPGPGTRANIDEFTSTTAEALRVVGGAGSGKAVIVINPADPPVLMRDTVYCKLPVTADREALESAVTASVDRRVAEVQGYVPGYRLTAPPQYEWEPDGGGKVTLLAEVEGAGDWFPPYAGNLDIMTAAAVRVGEALAAAPVPVGAA